MYSSIKSPSPRNVGLHLKTLSPRVIAQNDDSELNSPNSMTGVTLQKVSSLPPKVEPGSGVNRGILKERRIFGSPDQQERYKETSPVN